MKIPVEIRKRRSYIKDLQHSFSRRQLKEELEQVFCELNEKRKPQAGRC